MKVKLIFPPAFDEVRMGMPSYGMAVLTSFLRKKGYSVEQEDLLAKLRKRNFHGNFTDVFKLHLFSNPKQIFDYLTKKRINAKLENITEKIAVLTNYKNYDLIGFSIHSIFQFPFALALAKKIKEEVDTPIVFGGTFITLLGHTFFEKFPFVDYYLVGNGEIGMLNLLKYLQKHNIKKSQIPGLLYRDNEHFYRNAKKYIKIENMSIPDFGGLELENYECIIKGKKAIILPYQINRGCKNNCAFCTHHTLSDKLQIKSDTKVIKELKKLIKTYKTRFFYFCDSTINIEYHTISRLCDKIIRNKLNIKWGGLARLDNIDISLSKRLKKSGCVFLRYGIESGSQKITDLMGKRYNQSKIGKTIRNNCKVGILNLLNFVAGFPYETPEDILYTVKFIEKYNKFIHEATVGICYLEHGSPLQRFPEKYGITNIKKIPTDFIDYSNLPRRYYSFNEKKGLTWEKKKIQQEKANYEIAKTIFTHITKKKRKNLIIKLIPFKVYYYFNSKFLYHDSMANYIYHLINGRFYFSYAHYFNLEK